MIRKMYLDRRLLALAMLSMVVISGASLFPSRLIVDWWRSREWIQTSCQVEHVNWVWKGSTKSRYLVPEARYRYEFQGVQRQGSRVSLDDALAARSSELDFELRKAPGETPAVPCWVNPRRPSETVLSRDLPFGTLSVGLLGCILPALGMGWWLLLEVTGSRFAAQTATLRELHPGLPWRWRPEWAGGQEIRGSPEWLTFFGLAASALVLLISLPVALTALASGLAWFPLGCAGAVLWLVLAWIRRIRLQKRVWRWWMVFPALMAVVFVLLALFTMGPALAALLPVGPIWLGQKMWRRWRLQRRAGEVTFRIPGGLPIRPGTLTHGRLCFTGTLPAEPLTAKTACALKRRAMGSPNHWETTKALAPPLPDGRGGQEVALALELPAPLVGESAEWSLDLFAGATRFARLPLPVFGEAPEGA